MDTNREYELPKPRSKERIALLLNNPQHYIQQLNHHDIETLLTSLAQTDGLTTADIEDAQAASDPAPQWVRALNHPKHNR